MQIPEPILNECFIMWIEFGPTLGTALEPRIKEKFPEFSEDEIKYIVNQCVAAREMGHNEAMDLLYKNNELPSYEDYKALLKSKFTWLSEENISRLYSQSCYIAMK